jgi:hypothetical protein
MITERKYRVAATPTYLVSGVQSGSRRRFWNHVPIDKGLKKHGN